jgi:phosphopantetheinyl transferase
LIKIPFHEWKKINNFNLDDNQIHLWCFELPTHIKQIKIYENLQELQKQRRTLAQSILKNYTGQDLKNDSFSILPSGKPFLKENQLQFNISHSQHYLLMVIHRDKPIGIDFEFISKRHIKNFSKRFFGEKWYQTQLNHCPSQLQRMAFFQAWTQTEAWVKAHGETIFNYSTFEANHILSRNPWRYQDWQLLSFMPYVNGIASICCSIHVEEVAYKKINLSQAETFEHALIYGLNHE